MGQGRKPSTELTARDIEIVERFNSTLMTMPQLAMEYGITKQRVQQILTRAKDLGYVVKRRKLSRKHHTIEQCDLCRRLLMVANREELVTKSDLAQMLNVEARVCSWHLNQLKISGVVSKKFATVRSPSIIKALRFYRNSSLSAYAVGKKFGYKNFSSILKYQKRKGISVERTRQLH
jgi:hypothetical protein